MGTTLVIVESPAKAKKIQSLLGNQFRVAASVGHVRDLPLKDLGVDKESYKPQYVISDGKAQVVDNLKRLVKMSDSVILATDPDREGEAIAWHLRMVLNLPADVPRVRYQSITSEAIKEAMANATAIDMKRVAAQECRRVLDRLIGYQVSPALSALADLSLSAGRVQSVAVRFVVDREREITSFESRGYQTCTLRLAGHPALTADLDMTPFVKKDERLWLASDAQPFAGPQNVVLTGVKTEPKKVSPPAPLTTVEMQSVAAKVLGMTSKEAMATAQTLFDQGLITYHRTDFPNLSDEGIQKIQAYLTNEGIPVAQIVTRNRAKADAQEAHEAIRPTEIAADVAGQTDSEKALYALIRERAMLCVMPSGVDAVTRYTFTSERKLPALNGEITRPTYVATGKVITEPGWRTYARLQKVKLDDKALPLLTKGKAYAGSVAATQKQTEPPKRYTESTLTKAMEAKGIGRPSTYSAIMENIKNRGYIAALDPNKKDPYMTPQKLGYYVVDALSQFSFMSYTYTRAVEASLDKIAAGNMSYLNLVKPVNEQLLTDIEHKLQGESLALKGRCPSCEQPIVQRLRRAKRTRGNASKTSEPSKFWVHVDESHAAACVMYLDDHDDQPVVPPPQVKTPCPDCGADLIRRYSKKGSRDPYWAHVDHAQADVCGTKFFGDDEGVPIKREPVPTSKCVECGGVMKRRTNSKTQQPIWVHDAAKPKCGKKFLDDVDGVPENALAGGGGA